MLFDNDNLETLAEAGYTKLINQLSVEIKHMIHALLLHFFVLIDKAEIDQFKGLLKEMQLLIELQKHHICVGEKPLTAGNEFYIVGHMLYLVCILEIFGVIYY